MNKKVIVLIVQAVIFVSLSFFIVEFVVGDKVGKKEYTKEYNSSSFSSEDLIRVQKIRDGIATVTIEGSGVEMVKAGEMHELTKYSNHEGSIEFIEINEDNVKAKVISEKTRKSIIIETAIAIALSLLMSIILYRVIVSIYESIAWIKSVLSQRK